MSHTRNYRPPFDARHEFVVTPPAGRTYLPVGGVKFPAGKPFDKYAVDARRLRQMYEGRLIAIAPESKLPPAREKRPLAVGPTNLELTAKDMLAGKTRKSRPRATSRRAAEQAA